MSQLRIGLVPKHSKYFVIIDGFTSNLKRYNDYATEPFNKATIYKSSVHELNSRIKCYNPVILEVSGNSTLNGIKQQYPEYFI